MQVICESIRDLAVLAVEIYKLAINEDIIVDLARKSYISCSVMMMMMILV